MALALRCPAAASWQARRSRCPLCTATPTGGVSLMVAASGQGEAADLYMCSYLACPPYVRDKREAGVGARLHESLTLEEKIQRTVADLAAFITEVTA
ncbi:FBP domain-containing protein [Streptantibioticus silvisoli]|uniref:FBP domain-containing protein n=1 Tax=Streptantibioticus silvisoli TaxID=2705255 RepID=UPI0027E2C3F9|nr:FBP domain-containing protein [Streptantibioticus silvisoli]